MSTVTAIDHAKLMEFVGRFAGDLGAAFHAPLVLIGEELGLYKAMSDSEPVTPAALARQTGTDERYVREWLCAQAAGGYATYDAENGTFALSAEQALALANENGPAYFPGAFRIALSMMRDYEAVADAFRTGRGIAWHEHDDELFHGTEKFFRPNYVAHLLPEWIPALDGVEAKLKQGARMADIGCGHGASTIILAEAYPASHFFGFDYHQPSIARAQQLAREAGVGGRVTFQAVPAKKYPGNDYDLVACFDSLHDMGDPIGAATHVRQSLKPDGTWMLVEPVAGDRIEDNLNPVGRIYYSASTMICTPASRSQEVGRALGAQAGERMLHEIAAAAGFTRFRRVAETPFNLVFEVRP